MEKPTLLLTYMLRSTGEPDMLKGCVVVRSVESLLQTGGVERNAPGSSGAPEGESRRGKEHTRKAGGTGTR